MNDNELIDLIAQIWFENGGDSLGFDYCYQKIKSRIKELEEERNSQNKA